MELQDAQAKNFNLIKNVLRRETAAHYLVDFDVNNILAVLSKEHCIAVVLGFDMIERIRNDRHLSKFFKPTLGEVEFMRFVVGEFFGKLVLSCFEVPTDNFLVVESHGSGDNKFTKIINVIL